MVAASEKCPIQTEQGTAYGYPVTDLFFEARLTGPDGVVRRIPHRHRATGDPLGEAVLAVLAENDALRKRLAKLEGTESPVRKARS